MSEKSDASKKIEIDMRSPKLVEGETVLWSAAKHKGILKRSKVWEAVITNYRIFQYNWEEERMEAYCLLKDAELTVLNARRVRKSSWAGPFVYSRGVGAHGGVSKSEYITVGSIVVSAGGRLITRWDNIEDPKGVVELVKTIKKQLYMKK